MTDRYNPLVHEVNATVRMGAHPDGGYVLASDYDLLVTEHEKTESELATMTGAYLRVEADLTHKEAYYAQFDLVPKATSETGEKHEG